MCRILHRLGLSHKNVAERMLRGPEFYAGAGRQEAAFMQFQRRHFIHELVCFDETAMGGSGGVIILAPAILEGGRAGCALGCAAATL